ncbi:MAG: GTPase Era [candidate division KSB1 bacterium]|nr:GTPase Era [candidate division KSB1 bacterium]MDZ7413688.1 GTPase Era [candidate division KSB1 bacterium]
MVSAPDSQPPIRVGYVALVGKPNVGKSTLVNALLRFKLSIVTPKPQTTRHRILGILSEPGCQIILLDTPGLIQPRYALQAAMVRAAERAMAEADVIVCLLDVSTPLREEDLEMIKQVRAGNKSVLIALNKIDLVAKATLLPLIAQLAEQFPDVEIVPISALTHDGLEDLKSAIVQRLPEGVPLYPEDQLTEHPERFFVAELIREKIFERYGEEIPYATTVQIEEFKERAEGKDFISARIIVERPSQKAILIGKGGQALKELGKAARLAIEQFLGRQVFLKLWVAAREKWRSDETLLREYGYR